MGFWNAVKQIAAVIRATSQGLSVQRTVAPFRPGRPSKGEPPHAPGEYRWRNKQSGEIEYIGESADLMRRKRQHEKSSAPWSRETHDFEWKPADRRFGQQARRNHEKAKIAQHTPKGNKNIGGGGRIAAKKRK